jgi:hypothetical protein
VADASYIQSGFSGGEWSQFSQGRYGDPKYRTALNVCLNLIPTEQEVIVRRPGTQFAYTTRNSAPGRVISFAFQQQFPYTMELTDGNLRLRSGALPLGTDSVLVAGISNSNPAVVNLRTSVPWGTGTQAYFTGLGTSYAALQNRLFTLIFISSSSFQLIDPLTEVPIDGTMLTGPLPSNTFITGIADFVTPYFGGEWQTVRSVQTETISYLLHGSHPPQALNVFVEPSGGNSAIIYSPGFAPGGGALFTFNQAIFNDGPYLDPFTNGVQANASATSGIVSVALSFPTYSATTAYAKGAFVTNVTTNYESLIDQNVGNTPASSPGQWQPVVAGAAINQGQGFLGSDVGRLVRFFSEPDLWNVGSTYASGAVISYNPPNLPGQTTYWQSLVAGNVGNVPGIDLTHWQLLNQGGSSSPAIWTWGIITSLVTTVAAGGTPIGNMTGNGGLSAPFNNTLSQNKAASATLPLAIPGGNFFSAPAVTLGYVGKNFGGSPQSIDHVTIYPSNDVGLAQITNVVPNTGQSFRIEITLRLWASNVVPAGPEDGTLLGSSALLSNTTAPITIISNNQMTTWSYVWVEAIVSAGIAVPGQFFSSATLTSIIGQIVMFLPSSTSTSGNGCTVEILGGPLLYTSPIRTWRLGLYSNTTGWPTCGTYSDGRLWLSGVLPNRVDSCVSNGVPLNPLNVPIQSVVAGVVTPPSNAVNFAPTDAYGNVLASSAISALFDAPDSNPIFWMLPDLQGIICGTRGGEWLVQAPTAGPISPVNIGVRRVTAIGCANIEPRRTEHTTVFVQKFGRKVMEYFADVFSGKFTAPHITFYSKHLTVTNVQEIAYQQEINPVVWARLGNGNLIGWTYKRDTLSTSTGPNLQAGHRHALGSGRQVVSICTGPNVGGNLDALTMVTLDPATSLYYVEILGDTLDEGSSLVQANFLDCSVTPSSTTSNNFTPAPYGGLTVNGLWHLNSTTATAWLAGMDCGDYFVTNGSITVPYGDGIAIGTAGGLFTAAAWAANPVGLVGYTYTSQGQIVRPHAREETGARSGPAFGKKRRNHYVIAQLEGTQGVSFGTDFETDMLPAIFRQDSGKLYVVTQQFSGVWRDQVRNDYGFDGMLAWQVTRPYICNVIALGGAIQSQDI